MICVTLLFDKEGHLKAFKSEGHAGLAEEEGDPDLLCAAVSALCGSLVIGLQQVIKAPILLNEGDGLIDIAFEDYAPEVEHDVKVLVFSIGRALQELARFNVGFLEVEGLPEEDAV